MKETQKLCLTRRRFLAMGGAGVLTSACSAWGSEPPLPKRVLFIAGRSSHAFGDHRHAAGCQYLASCLNGSPNIKAEVMADHWPVDSAVFDDVDTVVIYGDGGDGHIVRGHANILDELIERGVGLGFLHYALMPPTENMVPLFLNGIGGYYEPGWSVNPMWHANIKSLPKHPITRGVKPFAIQDEWYYHMRFVPGSKGVQPLLSVLPPAETLRRSDGPHSNNPDVRKEVLELAQPQHLAWAFERADGGRGFGFSGGHYHWNWGHNDVRTLMLNAIAWLAHVNIPSAGIPSETPTAKELLRWLGSPPADFDVSKIERMLNEWNTKTVPENSFPEPQSD